MVAIDPQGLQFNDLPGQNLSAQNLSAQNSPAQNLQAQNLQAQDIQILFPCRQYPQATGGAQVLYRHVDLLNQYGFSAAIVHEDRGFRCNWFDNETRILYSGQFRLDDRTYVVAPEIYRLDHFQTMGRTKRVIFNQNAYYSFDNVGIDLDTSRSPYRHPLLVAVFTNSRDGFEYLTYAFPHLEPDHTLFHLHCGLDFNLFRYEPGPAKKKQLCFLSRKNYPDAVQVLQILAQRQAFQDFRVYWIEQMSQEDVAAIFRESMFFLSFGGPEGFGLPVAEAMACGCVVIGYHGGGGRELFQTELAYPIAQGQILDYARTVEQAIAAYNRNPAPFHAQGQAAAAFVRAHYSPHQEAWDLIRAWLKITGVQPPTAAIEAFSEELNAERSQEFNPQSRA